MVEGEPVWSVCDRAALLGLFKGAAWNSTVIVELEV